MIPTPTVDFRNLCPTGGSLRAFLLWSGPHPVLASGVHGRFRTRTFYATIVDYTVFYTRYNSAVLTLY
jgi:hypothetical protein